MTRPATTTRFRPSSTSDSANGLQFVAHYTWSKNLTHDGGYANIDPQVNYGPDDFNRKHVFSVSSVYELPFGKGKRFMGNAGRALNLLIGGFQLNTTTNWSSGLPWSASYNECSQDEESTSAGPSWLAACTQRWPLRSV